MRTKKRSLLTTKVYGFNPWMDQVTATNQMLESTSQKSEAPILRDLIDEALSARRRKDSAKEVADLPPPSAQSAETLLTIETLLLRMIVQEQSAFSIQSIALEFYRRAWQKRAGRMASWRNLIAPSLTERCKSGEEIAKLFEAQTDEAKDFAYGLAGEIKNQLEVTEADAERPIVGDDDRQGRLIYDYADTREDIHTDVV